MDSVDWSQKILYILLAYKKLTLTFQGEGKFKSLSHGRQLLARPRFTHCLRSFPLQPRQQTEKFLDLDSSVQSNASRLGHTLMKGLPYIDSVWSLH